MASDLIDVEVGGTRRTTSRQAWWNRAISSARFCTSSDDTMRGSEWRFGTSSYRAAQSAPSRWTNTRPSTVTVSASRLA